MIHDVVVIYTLEDAAMFVFSYDSENISVIHPIPIDDF